MAQAAQGNRFIHGAIARIIALIIGVGILGYMWVTWGEDMQKVAASLTDDQPAAPLVTPVGEERVADNNPALQACLEERVGHVDQMLKDGVIGEHQHAQFSQRASQLCRAQNPG